MKLSTIKTSFLSCLVVLAIFSCGSTEQPVQETSFLDPIEEEAPVEEATSAAETMPDPVFGEYTDERDNMVYKTVTIGDQIWFAENLKFKASEGNFWAAEDDETNANIYGYLYNWKTACEVCPDGWHLPSSDEWKELIEVARGTFIGGGNIKDKSELWKSPNTGASNATGFSALPGGWAHYQGIIEGEDYGTSYGAIGKHGYFWSSTKSPGRDDASISWRVRHDKPDLLKENGDQIFGKSVRCLK